MPDSQEHPGYYAIIPANVRYDTALSPSARILYAEITSLCNKKGYCWASNKYFAGLYDVDRSTITKWVKALSERGYIQIEYVYAEHTPNIQERKIYLTQALPALDKKEPDEPEGGGEIFHQGGEKTHQGGGEKTHRGGEKSQERILKANSKISAAADHTETETIGQTDPPKAAAAADASATLKNALRSLDTGLIFDEAFYGKALSFMNDHHLDSAYLSWLYELCIQKKPHSIAGFYFTVFFEPRFVALYREASRPPAPEQTLSCPVCGNEHEVSCQNCPSCGFNNDLRGDEERVKQHTILYRMPKEQREAYEKDMERLHREVSPSKNWEEFSRRLQALHETYGAG